MDIKICSEAQAVKYCPKVPTYAFRIFNAGRDCWGELNPEGEYVGKSHFFFDDITPVDTEEGLTLFSRPMAVSMLEAMILLPKGTKQLLFHCAMGASRSPGAAIAINDIFQYGHEELWHQYPQQNIWVRECLILTAIEMGLMPP